MMLLRLTLAVFLFVSITNVFVCGGAVMQQQMCNRGHYWRQFQSSNGPMSAIHLMCNTSITETESGTANNHACFGCFSLAFHNAQSTTFLNNMSSCATTYLKDTVYQPCADDIAHATSTIQTGTENMNCAAQNNVICNFEKCIHRTDKLKIVKNCIEEVNSITRNDAEKDEAQMYINTTACILASIKCGNFMSSANKNGASKKQNVWNAHQATALFVTDNYDLRAINVPRENLATMCGFNHNSFGVATWPGATC